MSPILVFGLILMVIIPTSEGVNWIGTFQQQGTCDVNQCCCPPNPLVITNTTNVIGTNPFVRSGHDCKNQTQTLVIPNAAAGATNIDGFGIFTLLSDNSTLEVLLEQDNQTVIEACKVTMARSGSSASGGGGGGGTNSGTNNKNQTTSANEASLNHGSILIKFISIIMTIGVIIHI